VAILHLYRDIGGRVGYRLYMLPNLKRGVLAPGMFVKFATYINFCLRQVPILPKSLVIEDEDVQLGGRGPNREFKGLVPKANEGSSKLKRF
jgi:hypothetical protein